ncbi:MAG TPA: hypothetical protein VHH11_13155 [Gammaproteobacteria bacterium]|jgi:hypothetical protein|nr:hypothetical protein [Gammaproteobacteria bacterium]
MLLAKLQALLHELYALDVQYGVDDFLITDAAFARALDTGGRDVDEKLLIAEADGEAEVALYLEAELLRRLAERDPLTCLDADNLADFWAALEGVSHFTYYAWNAQREKHVTLFELELQAEVDKFVTTGLLLKRQNGRELPALHDWLFDRPRLASELNGEERERYRRANRYAGKYCRRLAPALTRGAGDEAVQRELRTFYRLSQQSKLAHIDAQ